MLGAALLLQFTDTMRQRLQPGPRVNATGTPHGAAFLGMLPKRLAQAPPRTKIEIWPLWKAGVRAESFKRAPNGLALKRESDYKEAISAPKPRRAHYRRGARPLCHGDSPSRFLRRDVLQEKGG